MGEGVICHLLRSAVHWQVLCDMGNSDNITLASMHSISKGFYGECGRRGGYLELMNVSADVVSEFYKLASINLCSNLNGQICMALVMNPPKVCSGPMSSVAQGYWSAHPQKEFEDLRRETGKPAGCLLLAQMAIMSGKRSVHARLTNTCLDLS